MARTKKAGKKAAKGLSSRANAGTSSARRMLKAEMRKKDKKRPHVLPESWAEPAPSHLVAKLDIPKVKSKYQSYFEFADNTEKKKKKLEFQITDDPKPPPGFAFVPIGDPALTNACKDLSRERDAMIFIVSIHKVEYSKISEHMYRTGYHFREVIVDEAREIVGETVISRSAAPPGFIEPIPESQEEINKQADAAMRDLFPRIPNTDRTMIIEHAFRKGALFHGEPTVGLQSTIPLSRRVQLAVLAHIRHTHTRYDKLLRETSWMNARKAVEPVCLDVLVKWRGDEETGRDQMDEILREVVIITDSEEEDESSEDDSSDEDGEVTSDSSTEGSSEPASKNQQPRPASRISEGMRETVDPLPVVSARTVAMAKAQGPRDKKAQRGFKRYQAAWDEALHRKQQPSITSGPIQVGTLSTNLPIHNMPQPPPNGQSRPRSSGINYNGESSVRNQGGQIERTRSGQYYSLPRPAVANLPGRDEVIVRPQSERPTYYQDAQPRYGAPSHHSRDSRPPQVVRASPPKHELHDMLLPSIETTSSRVPSTHIDERSGMSNGRQKESYPRRVIEHERQSPLSRQVIVINDDSPLPKRRRVVHEDDAGNSRPISPHEQSQYTQPHHSDSPLLSASSAQPGNFPHHRPRVPSQSTQGLYKTTQTQWMGSAGEEQRLPVYDAPESGFFTTHPSQLGRPDVGYGSTHGGESRVIRQLNPPLENVRGNFHPPRPINEYQREHVRMADSDYDFRQAAPGYGRGEHFQTTSSPNFPVQSRISRSYDTGPAAAIAEQDFIHRFSQSRLDGPSTRPNDGFTILSEIPSYHQASTSQGNRLHRFESHSARSFAAAPFFTARSPVHFVERPMQYREETQQPTYEQERPQHYAIINRPANMLRDRQIPSSAAEQPTHVHKGDDRRRLIIID